MKKLLLAAMLAAVPHAAAQAQAMTVAQFLEKADPIARRGMVGMLLSSDARKLGLEIGAAAEAARADQNAARLAGRKTGTCLPPKGKAKVDVRELLAHLRSIPAAQRGMSFRAGFAGYVMKKYPCSS